MKVEVSLLDGSGLTVDCDAKDSGSDLLEKVAAHLNLNEKDYFGFLVQDKRDKVWTWLHADRRLSKQIKDGGGDARCLFQVGSGHVGKK